MLESRIIEFNGIFLGAAVALGGYRGWRFVAAHAAARAYDGAIAPSLDAIRRLARQAYLAARTKDGPAKDDAVA